MAIDYTVPNTLNLKQKTPGVKYAPLEVQTAAQNLKIDHSFPWLQSHLIGAWAWEHMAVKLALKRNRQVPSFIKAPCRAYLEAPNRHQPDRSTEK